MKTTMNKLKVFSALTLLALAGNGLNAQVKDEVLMTVNKKPVYKSEFENIYKKNNKETVVTKQALDDYMVLFTNFKLKVTEAEELGMDTVRKFKDELDGYRKQLAKPYLVDNNLNDELIKEAYERMKTEVRASHILVKCDVEASPEDTMKAYKRALMLRDKIMKSGNFEAVAVAPGNSDDPSAAKNKGDLGYFTSMQMVYPFENACYKMNVGDVSMPIRTRFGFHIIKLTDKRPSRGQIRVAHILIAAKEDDTEDKKMNARKKAEEILGKVKAGEDFSNLARTFSDDQSSGKKGGELPLFGSGRMVPEFEIAAFGLKNDGDVSEIVQTNYGYHIIKRLELKQLEPYDEKKAELKQRIQRDSRSYLPKKSFINKLKEKYKFVEFNKAKNLAAFYKAVDTTIFNGDWKIEKAKALDKPIFNFSDKKYTQKDFANYIFKRQRKQKKSDIKTYINNQYENFIADEMIAFEDSRLEDQYPEFKALMKEYRDGILLFDLTDKKVWSKAVKDTAGLKVFHEKNKNNYMHPERFDVVIYSCKDDAVAKKVRDELKKGKLTDEKILELINKDSQLNLKVEKGVYSKEDKEVLQKSELKNGLNANVNFNNQVVFVKLNKTIPPTPKTLTEAKGPITSDYQNFLEKEWLDSLKAKYPITVNNDVLYSIK